MLFGPQVLWGGRNYFVLSMKTHSLSILWPWGDNLLQEFTPCSCSSLSVGDRERGIVLAVPKEGNAMTAVCYETTRFQLHFGISGDWRLSMHTRTGNLLSIKQRGYQGNISGRAPPRLQLPVLPASQKRWRGKPRSGPTGPQQQSENVNVPICLHSTFCLGSHQSTCRTLIFT